MVNGLSDLDAQMLELYVVNLNSKRNNSKYTRITIRKLTLTQLMNSKTN